MQEVSATIAALPEDRRLALVAVDVLGLSYRDAARALRVREATITIRLFRAREQVAKQLAPAPDSPTSASPEPASPDSTDTSELRPARSPTVRGNQTLAGTPAPRGVGGGVIAWRGGVSYRLLNENDAAVVTWLRDGHLCVVSGRGVSSATLLGLASWSDHDATAS